MKPFFWLGPFVAVDRESTPHRTVPPAKKTLGDRSWRQRLNALGRVRLTEPGEPVTNADASALLQQEAAAQGGSVYGDLVAYKGETLATRPYERRP
jgi:hypothetical protein